MEAGWGQGVIATPAPILKEFKREHKQIEIPRPHQIFGPSTTTDFQGDREISEIGLLPLKRSKNFMNRRFLAIVL